MPNKKTAKKKVTTSKKVAAKKTAKTKKPKYKIQTTQQALEEGISFGISEEVLEGISKNGK